MDWDDIRYFLAVAQKGSIRGGSALLNVNHSTVSRRINAFEQKLDVRLFDRLPTGYVLTIAGEDMLQSALRIEDEVNALDRKVLGRESELSGTIRVTLPAPIMAIVTSGVVTFTERYPSIEIELLISYEEFNLNKREADIAIRVTNTPPENLVGRKILKSAKAEYGSTRYLAEYKKTGNSDSLCWIGWNKSNDEQWVKESHFPTNPVHHQFSDPMSQLAATKAGLGIAILPCVIGDLEPDLHRISSNPAVQAWDIWILTHKDLRDTTRIKIFMNFMTEVFRQQEDLLTGKLTD